MDKLQSVLEYLPCPMCGADYYRVIYESRYPRDLSIKDLLETYRSSSENQLMDRLVQCRSCSFIYLNPRVRSDIIMESYSNAVDPVFFEQNPSRISTFKRSLSVMMKRFQITPDPSRAILDVGCAGGAFLKAATDLGFSGVGIEPSQWLCEEGRKQYGLDLRAGILSDFEFQKSSFYMITLWDVLEHLTQPGDVLETLHSLLRGDGYLVVNVPNYDSLARQLLGRKWPFFLSVHLHYFTSKTMVKFLERHGFQTLSISPYFQTLELGYVLKRAIPYFGLFSLLDSAAHKLKIDHFPVRYNVGQSMFVAKKR